MPRQIMNFEYAPNRKLVHFLLKLRNEPGGLEASCAIATRSRVNILSGFHEAPATSKEASWSFFADFTEAKIEPNKLAEEFAKVPTVLSVDFKPSSRGLIIDEFHFPLLSGKNEVVVIPSASLRAIFRRMKDVVGSRPAAIILNQIGEATGKASLNLLKERLGEEILRDQILHLAGLSKAAGWGSLTVRELDFPKTTSRIEIAHNFECIESESDSKEPESHFLGGVLSGALSQLFDKRMHAEEVRCVAKGDEVCEFVINPV